MRLFQGSRRKLIVSVGAVGLIAVGGAGIAAAATSGGPNSNARSAGRGINEYGMTHAYFSGRKLDFTYGRGFYCDTKVSSAASSKCEAGANYKKAPGKNFDPLYITVPLGFTRPNSMLDCPQQVICVDHPGTMDLSRLEPALKPLYPKLTNAQLTAALKNFQVPGHDHFITTTNGGKREYWDTQIVGVTSPSVYKSIIAHRSYHYIRTLIAQKNKNVVGPIPTNLFLFFSVQG